MIWKSWGDNVQPYKKYIRKYLLPFLVSILFLSLETFSDLMQPMLVSKLIDNGVSRSDFSIVRYYGTLMLFTTFVGMIGALMRNWISSEVSFKFAMELREELFNKLLKIPMLKVEEFERGSLITRLTGDVNQVQLFVNGIMRIFLKAPLLAIGSFLMVINLDKRFLGIYMSIVPLSILIVIINLKIGFPLFDRIQMVVDTLNQRTMEYLSGIRTVKAFNRFDYEKERFTDISTELRDSKIKTLRIMAIFGPMIQLVVNMAVVFVIFVGKDWVNSGDLGVGEIVAFTNYMTQFYFALHIMTRIFIVFVRAKTSAKRISEVLSVEVEDNLIKDQVPKDYSVEFKNVNFRYGEGENTIENIDFKIENGTSVGVLGSTGSGKSTLIHLINGILKPTSGSIYVGGADIKYVDKEILNEIVAYVPQKSTLFTGSVKENVFIGESHNDDDICKKALDTAMASEFVDAMPEGVDTIIGKNGVNISGGQKQRISIARAIASRPKILILDDSTSALDVLTERRLKDNIKNMEEHTLIIVAQKISSVKDLDKILVLNDGKIEAYGTHEELLLTSQTYKAIYASEYDLRRDA